MLLKDTLRRLKRSWDRNREGRRFRGIYSDVHGDLDPERHIREATEWLKRAQDDGPDRGVAYGVRFGGDFLTSYPETTGYIIPTFLRLAEAYRDDDLRRRAVEMGHWEADIQMECGAVMGGRADMPASPAVFNTGQVLLGWVALYEETAEPRFLAASRRAAGWLVSIQEPDGNWIAGNSRFAGTDHTVYNARTAWGLARYGAVAGDAPATEAARRNGRYALKKQRPNGWFADCCLDKPVTPLTHTLAYTAQGLLELGRITGDADCVEGARKAADAAVARLGPDGFLAGRFDERWEPKASWCCLTGSAQFSILWSRLFALTGDERYKDPVRRTNRYLMARHDLTSPDKRIRGGVPGSWPPDGDYGRFRILNWATKFLLDALLLEKGIREPAG